MRGWAWWIRWNERAIAADVLKITTEDTGEGDFTTEDTEKRRHFSCKVGADVVEYNPVQDLGGVTATVAAKIVKEILEKVIAG